MTARDAIPQGGKIVLTSVAIGEAVLKYGQYIGVAIQPIAAADQVHSHNLVAGEHRGLAGTSGAGEGIGGGAQQSG